MVVDFVDIGEIDELSFHLCISSIKDTVNTYQQDSTNFLLGFLKDVL